MGTSTELLINAIISGILLGGVYSGIAVGITIAFGMLDIVNIAHPAFVMLGAFLAYWLNANWGIDPLAAMLLVSPVAYAAGCGIYRFYNFCFERRGEESLQGLAFFFGILFIVEVGLLLVFGVDYRSVDAFYIGPILEWGPFSVSTRLLVPLAASLAVVVALRELIHRSFVGRAILAVSQDPGALRLVGVNPTKIKEIAFGIAIVTAVASGALLIIIQPVEPSIGRDFIGRVFAICVLGGMTSLTGTVLASIVLGVSESITATFVGPSWGPAISFGLLLVTLSIRPSGILGR